MRSGLHIAKAERVQRPVDLYVTTRHAIDALVCACATEATAIVVVLMARPADA
jgi:hypothetical protein